MLTRVTVVLGFIEKGPEVMGANDDPLHHFKENAA
jgi:hypothetical protein